MGNYCIFPWFYFIHKLISFTSNALLRGVTCYEKRYSVQPNLKSSDNFEFPSESHGQSALTNKVTKFLMNFEYLKTIRSLSLLDLRGASAPLYVGTPSGRSWIRHCLWISFCLQVGIRGFEAPKMSIFGPSLIFCNFLPHFALHINFD